MKILHTADWHVGKALRGRSRAEEHAQVLGEIVEIAAERQVDLVLVAGDLFDSAAPPPEAEKLVYGTLLSLASNGAEVAVVAGNHDHPSRLGALAPLLEHVHVAAGSRVLRPELGGMRTVKTRTGEEARVVLLPFVSHKSAIRSAELLSIDSSQLQGRYADYCGRIVEVLCEQMDTRLPNLLVGHFAVMGGVAGGGERPAHMVEDYYVPAQIFPGSLNYVALGHLHGPQKIAGKCPIWYSGSPLQLDFGESEKPCEVLIVEASAGKPAQVERVKLRSGRKLTTLTGTLDELEPMAGQVGDDYLRLRLQEPATAGLADRAREIFPGAVHIEVQQGEARRRDRAETDGVSPTELFRMYLRENNALDDNLVRLFGQMLEENYETAES